MDHSVAATWLKPKAGGQQFPFQIFLKSIPLIFFGSEKSVDSPLILRTFFTFFRQNWWVKAWLIYAGKTSPVEEAQSARG